MEYNKRMWGGDGWTEELKEKGRKYGLTFSNWRFWPNTLLAHSLVHAAKVQQKSAFEVLEALFVLSYEKGGNVSDVATLEQVAESFGVKDWRNEENERFVLGDWEKARQRGINSVPYFDFGDDVEVNGSGSVELFLEKMEERLD